MNASTGRHSHDEQYRPEACHAKWLNDAPRALQWRDGVDFESWRNRLRERWIELLGRMPAARCPLDVRTDDEQDLGDCVQVRLSFASEPGARVPATLLVPKGVSSRPATVICLQGHSSGHHISLGQALYSGDAQSVEGDRDFARQAVARGYAALAVEQRCLGLRLDRRRADGALQGDERCRHASLVAMLVGRTMAGERAWDVSRACDLIESIPQLDPQRIACMGNSGGGTATWYAATIEPRISAIMPSCSVCEYAPSIGVLDHCTDNYVPGVLQYFDMPDLAGLIAPRPACIVAGRHDAIFPFDAMQRSFDRVSAIYQAAGAADRCHFVVGEG